MPMRLPEPHTTVGLSRSLERLQDEHTVRSMHQLTLCMHLHGPYLERRLRKMRPAAAGGLHSSWWLMLSSGPAEASCMRLQLPLDQPTAR